MQRGVRVYHDQTTRPLHDMRWELLTLLAHGAFVTALSTTSQLQHEGSPVKVLISDVHEVLVIRY
jgi:hypothetical protein